METCRKGRSLDLPVICEIITYWSHAQAKQLWLWLCQLWIDSSQADILTDRQADRQAAWYAWIAGAQRTRLPLTQEPPERNGTSLQRACLSARERERKRQERGWEWGRDTDIDGMWIRLLGGWMSEATPKHRFRNQFNSYGVARQQTAKMKKLRLLPLALRLAVTMSRKSATKQRGINRNRTPFSSVWQAKQSVRLYEQCALAVGEQGYKKRIKATLTEIVISLYYIRVRTCYIECDLPGWLIKKTTAC